MKALLLSAALALGAGAAEPQEPGNRTDPAEEQETELSATPKAPVAGMTGFRSKSRIRLSSDPEQVFLLEAFYVFPERVRWSLIPEGAPATRRRLDFRFGSRYWSIAPGASVSQSTDATDPQGCWTVLHMELRRAVMLWPNGLEWEGTGSQLSALSPEKVQRPFTNDPLPLVLLAHLDDAGRPREMFLHYLLPDGATQDTRVWLRDITWHQQGDRWWPASFVLRNWTLDWWSETVDSVDVGVHAIDSFFVPPDRRDASGLTSARASSQVLLPAVVQRRVQLPADMAWEDALEEARRLAREEAERLEPLGGRLEADVFLELDEGAAPRAVLLRAETAPAPLPDGWEATAPREALTQRLAGDGAVPLAVLRRLQAQVPPAATPEPAYVRLAEGACQVVQPFRAPR